MSAHSFSGFPASTHSIPLSAYLEIHLCACITLHSVECIKPVLNGKSAGGGWRGSRAEACLLWEEHDSELETVKPKKRTLLFCSLCIMHRHCRTLPQDVTHPCDIFPSPPLPPRLPPQFPVFTPSSQLQLTMNRTQISEKIHNNCHAFTQRLFTSSLSERLVHPRQHIVTHRLSQCDQMTHLLMLTAAEGVFQ